MESYTFAGADFRTQDLSWRLICSGLPAYLSIPFAKEVEKWLVNSGAAWTVERLKSLRQDLIRSAANLPTLTYVRKNRKGQWAGVIGGLFRYAQKGEKPFRRAFVAFSCYTGFRPTQPTLKHMISFRENVEGLCELPCQPLFFKVAQAGRKLLGLLPPGEEGHLITYQGHPSKRSPGLESSVPQDDQLEEEIRWLEELPENHSFCSVYYQEYEPVFRGIETALVDRTKWKFSTSFHEVSDYMFRLPKRYPPWSGNVVPLTKDGGWKVRWIANPLRSHQLALKPLGDALFKCIRNLPWDCTFHQERPIRLIQDHLRKGGVAHAIDLKSATDFFPLSLQIEVLSAIYPDRGRVCLFRDLSRGLWRSPMGPVRWTRGQPMGLYPSFASFALVHGLLLFYLNGEKHENDFFVLGDDVIILNDALNQAYRKTLCDLECPVDENKSLSSNVLTEFAGKVITTREVYPKFKIGLTSSHKDSFMDILRTYGQNFRFFFPKRIRKAYEAVAHLCAPIGLEHTLSGPATSLVQRVAETDQWLELLPEPKGGKLFVSFLNYLTVRLKPERQGSLYHRLGKSVAQLAAEFERKRLKAEKGLPVPLCHEDVTDILEFTGVNTGLPALGPSSGVENRKTLLSQLEELIKLRTARMGLKGGDIRVPTEECPDFSGSVEDS